MPKFICVNKCYFRNELHSVGAVVEFPKGTRIPRHFEKCQDGAASTVDKLRRKCDERKLPYEPNWGIDRLSELLGILPQKRVEPQVAAKKEEEPETSKPELFEMPPEEEGSEE